MVTRIILSAVFFVCFGCAAFASDASVAELLDRGKEKKGKADNAFTTNYNKGFNNFTLRSGREYRGDNVIANTESKQTINLNTTVTYKNGKNSINIPYKKRVVVGSITFNSNEALRNTPK